MNPLTISIIKEKGSGRPYVLLTEKGTDCSFLDHAFDSLSIKARCVLIRTDIITDQNWETILTDFNELLQANKIRNCSIVAYGAVCALAQALALREPKLIRTLVIINGATRARPTRLSKLIDRVERLLPLGLPMRLSEKGFDSKPFLQRIRAPVLVVTTDRASGYEHSEAKVLEGGLPTAWLVSASERDPQTFANIVVNFQEVPAKCPQGS